MDVAAIWHEHQAAPFPYSCLKLALGGVPLVKLDAEAGAILTASLRTDGVPRALAADRRAVLARCRERIVEVLRDVPLDPEARAYFERVDVLAQAVLAVKE
jgi:plasmid stability protein